MATTMTELAIDMPTAAVVPDQNVPLTAYPLLDRCSKENTRQGIASPPPPPASSTKSRLRHIAVTFQLSGVSFTASAVNGLVVVGLPAMTSDLSLPPSLAFWPASAAFMATTASLLLAGSLADIIGPRPVELVGALASGAFMVGCGLSRRGEELVALRALQGVALAMHLASSVSLLTMTWPQGRSRNVAFSCLGISQVLGFSLGLVLGGVFVDTVGWRAGWHIYGGITLALTALGLVILPKGQPLGTWREFAHGIATKMDLVGALLASAFMAFLSYFLAVVSQDVHSIRRPENIVFLCLGALSLPLFVYWVHRQARVGKPALIPNALWRNTSFSTICGAIAISYGVLVSLELFASLFFQEVQHLSALQAAVRIIPSLIVGFILNLTTGLLVHKVPVVWIVAITSILTAGSPLLMALIQPQWTYWTNAFVAQLLMPFNVDVLFTVGLIMITDSFPHDRQALAGAVFNTSSQFGKAIGLAVMQVISTVVTRDSDEKNPVEALMEGYRASFWTMFALMLSCAVLGGLGLRKAGKIGLKRD
ncbi:hypothetical protein S40293_03630 [Stachybotrys chartarum IBT 40293]|nr:hypothetical protein S40293_03630 [Stachybotrys chartarum IBT 40293]